MVHPRMYVHVKNKRAVAIIIKTTFPERSPARKKVLQENELDEDSLK